MLLESMILAACIKQAGCSDLQNAYLKQNPDIAQQKADVEHNLSKMGMTIIKGNEWTLYMLSPMYMLVTRQPKIKIGKFFYVSLGDTKGGGFEWHF